jgi:hypothetical protein
MAQTNANLIWKIAELLRGTHQREQCGEPSAGPGGGGVAGLAANV